MKKITDVYSKIITKENLYQAAYLASRGRRYSLPVADFNFGVEKEIEKLYKELSGKTYRHGNYRVFTVYEPKERKIAAAPFRDRVIHHALTDIIEPIYDKSFIYDSYACRVGKGTHKALDRAQSFLRKNKYCLHADIKKYFFSIDHNILKKILLKKIEDNDVLWLINEIIDSANQLSGISVYKKTKGLPIGNLTSQFFANLYLNELDFYVKFRLGSRYYLRYMDDFLLFSDDKGYLKEARSLIREFLANKLGLKMHEEKSKVYDVNSGVKFLGFRLYKSHRRLASANSRRFNKRLTIFSKLLDKKKITYRQVIDSLRCWVNHSQYAKTGGLRLSLWNKVMKKNKRLGLWIKDVMIV